MIVGVAERILRRSAKDPVVNVKVVPRRFTAGSPTSAQIVGYASPCSNSVGGNRFGIPPAARWLPQRRAALLNGAGYHASDGLAFACHGNPGGDPRRTYPNGRSRVVAVSAEPSWDVQLTLLAMPGE